MEKKIYLAPKISETKLDSEINLVLMSDAPNDPMMMIESNQTDGTDISQFMNPLKWFK
jgi:hypothetical protein